ncbi:hypothetical protein GTY86_35755 [Streptomyces sp. SID5770]|uniref:hypothetical protein n=1 Tax=Streptomyces sp. SID5770 TaxID=2690308 RepID=UPI00137014D3|nr:hypothetical protein [Streptomyces sp. SID5770]MZE53780.1 hypothetical protein [Streptomyces sp. SID5770]MZE56531.1 hypothetical protein [Streptomyces sp. SID5770]
MTGPEHYREAERWLAHAKGAYLDTSSHPAPREEYASDEEWYAAISKSAEAHELMLRETAVFAALGQAHATLALAAVQAAQLADRYIGNGDHINDWRATTSNAPHIAAEIAE